MMEFEVLTAAAICGFVYVLSRVVSWIEHEKAQKLAEQKEQDRLSKVAALYGRNEK